MERAGLGFWESVSTRFSYSPPLTPGETDIAWYRDRAQARLKSAAAPACALLLGVTPGIAGMPRPDGTMLVPVDWSAGMIRNVLAKAGNVARTSPVRGDWRELPLADRSCEVAFSDLFLPALPTFQDARLAFRELARVLRKGGLFCLRSFLRLPEEAPPDLLRELAEGRTPDVPVFRMRLAAAVQGSSPYGVSMADVWTFFDQRFPDRQALGRLYPPGAFDAIERWKGLQHRYAFTTLDELRELAAPHFELVETVFPSYVTGNRMVRAALRNVS